MASALGDAMYTDTGLVNNQEYYYQVTATYGDGTESDYSEVVYATPFANTVYEASYDDGSADAFGMLDQERQQWLSSLRVLMVSS